MLDRIQPVRIGTGIFQKPIARTQRPLQRRYAAGMRGVDREHQPVEETPAFRSRSAEQPVHRRRQPDDAQVIGESRPPNSPARGRSGRAAWSRPRPHAAASIPVPSVARPSAPSTSADTAQEPSPSLNATSSSVARRRPRPGARNEIGFEQIGLAGAVRPRQHDRTIAQARSALRDSCGNWSASGAGCGRRAFAGYQHPLVPAKAGIQLFRTGFPLSRE